MKPGTVIRHTTSDRAGVIDKECNHNDIVAYWVQWDSATGDVYSHVHPDDIIPDPFAGLDTPIGWNG